jgi:RHS repeat-associated protein
MTVEYKYDAGYLLKNLNYGWGGYHLNQGYVYNTLDKITDNLIDYNLSAPEVAGEMVRVLGPEHDGIDYPALDDVQHFYQGRSFTNKYTYDKLGRMTSSTVYGINPQLVPGISNNSDHRPKVQVRQQTVRNTVIDPNGNPKSKRIESLFDTITNVTTETNYYNDVNQLTGRDVVNQSSPIQAPRINYTYDDFGNLLGESAQAVKTPPTYTYGPDQQMSRSLSESLHNTGSKYENGQNVVVPDCYTRNEKLFAYELGGKLVKIKSNVHDDSNIYDRIDDKFSDYFYYSHDGAVAERHDDIGETKYFTRLGGELLACDDAGQSYYYIQNIRGDVMALVGTDGVVKSVRDYDASGQMLCKAPGHSDRDPFGFTGGLDAGNGMWKLGARFYDSSKNSFIQQDRYMGDPSDPLSLNRYVYCGLDPVNNVDPTGFMGVAVYGEAGAEVGIAENLQWGFTVQVGIATFQNGGSYTSSDRIGYTSTTAIADVNNKQNEEFIAGGYAGAGVGVTFTSADSAEAFKNIPKVFNINTPLGSLGVSYGNGDFSLSISIGPGLIASISNYRSDTQYLFW